jgi:hypothetical protein
VLRVASVSVDAILIDVKISVRDLKKLIKEVAMSPAVFQTEPVQNVDSNKNLVDAISGFSEKLRSTMQKNLVLSFRDKFDSETRNFDDVTFKHIQNVVDKVVKQTEDDLRSLVSNAISISLKKGSVD